MTVEAEEPRSDTRHHYETQQRKMELRLERRKTIEECVKIAESFMRDRGMDTRQRWLAGRIADALLLRLRK